MADHMGSSNWFPLQGLSEKCNDWKQCWSESNAFEDFRMIPGARREEVFSHMQSSVEIVASRLHFFCTYGDDATKPLIVARITSGLQGSASGAGAGSCSDTYMT